MEKLKELIWRPIWRAYCRYRNRAKAVVLAPAILPFPPSAYQNIPQGVILWGKNLSFMDRPKFKSAYAAGMNSGFKRPPPWPADADIHIELRTAVGCWAARHASLLKGDFVECGVNTGTMSLAICEYLDFNSIDKRFFLFDTYEGIPLSQINDVEAAMDRASHNEDYFNSYELVKRNFSPYPRVQLIKGVVPDSFVGLDIESVAYLSIDMNIAYPERASIEYFWPKLTAGAIVLLDDYGWLGYDEQKKVMDDFAAKHGTEVLTLLTGQGLLLKP